MYDVCKELVVCANIFMGVLYICMYASLCDWIVCLVCVASGVHVMVYVYVKRVCIHACTYVCSV